MGVSPEAGKALSLISGLDLLIEPGVIRWQSVVTRIVYDLDEQGHAESVAVIRGMLADLWWRLKAEGEGDG